MKLLEFLDNPEYILPDEEAREELLLKQLKDDRSILGKLNNIIDIEMDKVFCTLDELEVPLIITLNQLSSLIFLLQEQKMPKDRLILYYEQLLSMARDSDVDD